MAERLAGLVAELGRSPSLELRRGAADAGLFTWRDLDQTLVCSPDAWRRVDSRGRRQLSLAVESALVPAEHVLDDRARWGGLSVSLERLRRSLDDGATLMVNDAHALWPPLAGLAHRASARSTARVTVRAFASTGASPGFRPHIDLTDTVVVQTEGRKSWAVWARRGPRPVKDDVIRHQPPEEGAAWRGVLAEGDVLHVPAGWWHRPVGLGEPSLHLSFDIHSMLRWDVLRTGGEAPPRPPAAPAGAGPPGWGEFLRLAHLGRDGSFFHDSADGTFPSPVRVRPAPGAADRKDAWTPQEIDDALRRGGVVRIEHVERFLPAVAAAVEAFARGARATAALVGRGPGSALSGRAEGDLLLRQLDGGSEWRIDPGGRTVGLGPGAGELHISAGACFASPAASAAALHLEIVREPWAQARLHRLARLGGDAAP